MLYCSIQDIPTVERMENCLPFIDIFVNAAWCVEHWCLCGRVQWYKIVALLLQKKIVKVLFSSKTKEFFLDVLASF